jgi:putative DNA primase/helicase
MGPVRVIRLKGRRELGKGWRDVPTLCLDAVLDPALLQPYWPTLQLTADVRAEAKHQHIRQVSDRTYSKAFLDRAATLRNLHAVICREARRYAPARVLAVTQLAVEQALLEIGPLPANLELAHHNAVAGRDEWGAGQDRDGVAALIVVGRTMPSPSAAEDMAEALTGEAIERLEGWYPGADCTREMADGTAVAVQADRHPHPVAEAIRWQIAEGELVQIIGRARGVNRTEADPVDVLVMTSVPLPVPLNEIIAAAHLAPSPADLMLAAGGVVLSDPTDAAAAYPHVWATRKAAKSAMERQIQMGTKSGRLAPSRNNNTLIRGRGQPPGFCPHLREVQYQVAGAGRSSTAARHDPSVVPDLAAWLTQRLGRLAWVGERPKPVIDVNVIEAMALRGIIPKNPAHAARLFPDLFPSRDAAKKAMARVLNGRRVTDLSCALTLTVKVRYQVAGPRMSPAAALVTPERLQTLEADLAAAFGNLAFFAVCDDSAEAE